MNEVSDKKVFSSAIGWMGVMLVFLFILLLAYWPNKAPVIEDSLALERSQKVLEIQAKQLDLTSQYSVEADGRYRIPIENAMEFIIPQLNETAE